LMQYETIDAKQIKEIMDGNKPSAPEGWSDPGANPPKGDKTESTGEASSSEVGSDDQDETSSQAPKPASE
jgi:cell division protease FtsH